MPTDITPFDAPADPNSPADAAVSPAAPELPPPVPTEVELSDGVRPFVFSQPALLSTGQLRKLRQRHEEFDRSLSTRLAIYLRMECAFHATSLDTRLHSQWLEALPNPSHFAQFRIDGSPSPGLLEMSPQLGIAFVDRLCGGPGKPIELQRGLSELEVALLDRVVHLIVQEWCHAVLSFPEAKPQWLGHETNPRFLTGMAGHTTLLVVPLEARLGECAGKLHLGVPFDLVELALRPPATVQPLEQKPPVRPAAPPKWNPLLNSVNVALTASWEGIEITVRQLAALKAGDMLSVNPALAGQTHVRLGTRPKFTGRLGRCGGARAVELTETFAP